MRNRGLRIFFRVDADSHIGTGHLYECLWLAQYLKARALFCIRENVSAQTLVRQHGFSTLVLPAAGKRKGEERSWIKETLHSFMPHAVVTDILAIRARDLEQYSIATCPLIILNAIWHPIRPTARLPNAITHITTVFTPLKENKKFFGPQYILLREGFRHAKPISIAREVKNIFILFGGADPNNFTLKALRALHQIPGQFAVMIVVGRAFKFSDQVQRFLSTFSKPYHLYTDIQSDTKLIRVMEKSNLALVSGGYTLSELLRLGVPCIALSQNRIEDTKIFANFPQDAFRYMGRGTNISVKQLAHTIQKLMADYPARKKLSQRAHGIVDGKGIQRVAKIITQAAHV